MKHQHLSWTIRQGNVMNDIVQVTLYDRMTEAPVVAEIAAMNKRHICLANSTWMASFQQRRRLFKNDEDAWLWDAIDDEFDLLISRKRLQPFAVMQSETILGVLLLECRVRNIRFGDCQPLVYVHYVATAPWNRRDHGGVGGLRGVGTSLMAWANRYSHKVGCEGRVGLHSLRSSNAFYARLGYRDCGIDAAHRGMNYFEGCMNVGDFPRSCKCCFSG